LRVGDLSASEITQRLASGRFRLRTGPFTYAVRTNIAPLPAVIPQLYRDFPLAEEDALVDFPVNLVQPSGVRGWLLREVDFLLGGHFHFEPFQRRLALPYFEWGLNWCISQHAHQYLLLHAASLERHGRGLLIAGHSGAGKSTLAAALTLAGWRLLSDEFAMVDAAGELAALARPISLKNESIELVRARANGNYLGPASHSPRKGQIAHLQPPRESVERVGERAQPGWLVMLHYQPGSKLALAPLSKAQTMMHVAFHSFNYGLLGSDGFSRLVQLIDQSVCLRLTYSDLDEAVGLFNGDDFKRP